RPAATPFASAESAETPGRNCVPPTRPGSGPDGYVRSDKTRVVSSGLYRGRSFGTVLRPSWTVTLHVAFEVCHSPVKRSRTEFPSPSGDEWLPQPGDWP